MIGPDVLFTNGSDKLAALMLRHALPAIQPASVFAALASCGALWRILAGLALNVFDTGAASSGSMSNQKNCPAAGAQEFIKPAGLE